MAMRDELDENVGVLPELTLAVSSKESPFLRVMEDLFRVISGGHTVTVQYLVTPSSFALIRAVPCLMAVILPYSSTTATLVLDELQVTSRFDVTVAFSNTV